MVINNERVKMYLRELEQKDNESILGLCKEMTIPIKI